MVENTKAKSKRDRRSAVAINCSAEKLRRSPGKRTRSSNGVAGRADSVGRIGAFMMLGACPPGVEAATAPFNHSPEAVFDDVVLADGAAIYAELALRRLAR